MQTIPAIIECKTRVSVRLQQGYWTKKKKKEKKSWLTRPPMNLQ